MAYKLRPLEIFPTELNGKKALAVRDPVGYLEDIVVLPLEFAGFLSLLDGKHSIRDIQLLLTRSEGRIVFSSEIENMLKLLDRYLLLESPYFEKKKLEIEERFRRERIRKARLSGSSYPESRALLEQWMDELFKDKRSRRTEFKAFVVPHLDIKNCVFSYVSAYENFVPTRISRIIVLGTGHYLDDFIALTEKDFETPLGVVETDREWVKRFRELSQIERDNEFYHKNEHSVEFQTLFIKYRFPNTRIVPFLVGSLQKFIEEGREPLEDERFKRIVYAFRSLLDEGTYVVASVDFSHVGPRYGDAFKVGEREKLKISDFDHDLVQSILKGDRRGFWEKIVKTKNAFKVCGVSALYLLLCILDIKGGEILNYGIWEDGQGSAVSYFALGLIF